MFITYEEDVKQICNKYSAENIVATIFMMKHFVFQIIIEALSQLLLITIERCLGATLMLSNAYRGVLKRLVCCEGGH